MRDGAAEGAGARENTVLGSAVANGRANAVPVLAARCRGRSDERFAG